MIINRNDNIKICHLQFNILSLRTKTIILINNKGSPRSGIYLGMIFYGYYLSTVLMK